MTLEPKPAGYMTRLRFGRDAAGKELRERFLIAVKDLTLALDRERRMALAAAALGALQHPQAREFLTEMGRVAADDRAFGALEQVVAKLVAEAGSTSPLVESASGPSTFRDVAERWCSGELTRDYPDHELLPDKSKEARAEDRAIITFFYPALGNMLVRNITLADIDAARRLIPRGMHHNTRRKYALKLRMVLRLAESPLRLVERAPQVDIPRRQESNLFGFLYPQEEALVLARTPIPLKYRVLYGYLTRNGCRISETLLLTWDHIDLQTGDIHIDRKWTKTKKARRWVLDADVVRALEAYWHACGKPKGSALVFPGRAGKRLTHGAVRKRFTKDLRDAGVTRKSLLVGADGIEPLRVHDLRASFITLALRLGKSHKWIMTRTGHATLGMLQVYDRLVVDANEHHLPAWFAPMDEAIPELEPRRSAGPRPGQTPENAAFMGQVVRSLGTDEPGESGQKPREKPPSVTPGSALLPTSGPAEFQGVGQPGPGGVKVSAPEDTSSPVERALAAALQAAIDAQQWSLAQSIVAELGERRRARTAPTVPSLADARKKREDR